MPGTLYSKSDEYGFMRPDDFDYKEFEKFMSSYITILARNLLKWDRYMDRHPQLRQSDQLKYYVRKGIPLPFREEVWMAVSGAKKLKDTSVPNFYRKMVKTPISEDVKNIITVDIPRTYPNNIYFHPDAPHHKILYRILSAFAACNPNIGYCQGFNYIAGLLLLVTEEEETCFWLLRILVENKLPDYYSKTMDGVIVDIEVFSRLVKKKFPEVAQHMSNLDMPWALVSTKWFICLFAEVLPNETTLRVWDCLFYEGSKVLFRAGLILVKYYKDELLACEDITSLAECFKSIMQRPFPQNCHLFIKQMFSDIGPLPMSLINNLRKEISAERKADNSTYTNRKG